MCNAQGVNVVKLKEAIQLAEHERKSKVVGAADCGDRWAFSFDDDVGKTDGMPMFVHKSDGKSEIFCPAEFMYAVAEGQAVCEIVPLPE